jgi:ABC-type multidrug transport system ATPase subunit
MTRVVVAHRLSTMAGADRILVIQNGRLVESGTYEDLVVEHGRFHALASRQVLRRSSSPARSFGPTRTGCEAPTGRWIPRSPWPGSVLT